eukprot:2532814-Amphidinium_carterae.1
MEEDSPSPARKGSRSLEAKWAHVITGPSWPALCIEVASSRRDPMNASQSVQRWSLQSVGGERAPLPALVTLSWLSKSSLPADATASQLPTNTSSGYE